MMSRRSARVSTLPYSRSLPICELQLGCRREDLCSKRIPAGKRSRRRYITEREESQSHEHLQEGTDALKQKLMKRCHAEELVDKQLESVLRFVRPSIPFQAPLLLIEARVRLPGSRYEGFRSPKHKNMLKPHFLLCSGKLSGYPPGNPPSPGNGVVLSDPRVSSD